MNVRKMNEEISRDIEIEAKRIAKWLDKKREDYRDYFISRVIVNFKMDLFESLGLLEYVKSEIIRMTQEEIKKTMEVKYGKSKI